MTKVPQPASWSSHYDLTYDAWNRLTKVQDGSTVIEQNKYDGLGKWIVVSGTTIDVDFCTTINGRC
jgi:YD repeat-containing protein